jgi:hypothetical protein
VKLRARWVTLRARWVMLRARWVTLRARRVTLRARWVTLRASWVTFTGIGSAPPFFSQKYVPLKTWWTLGFILSIFYIVSFLGIGSVWWPMIGLM